MAIILKNTTTEIRNLR